MTPPEWLEEQKARVGGEVYVSAPECGIDGNARVLSLGACPKIHDLDGRVVTAVFRHHSAEVLDLHIVGMGTLKNGQPLMKIYRGNGITIVLTSTDEFATALTSGRGLDLLIKLVP